MTFQESGTIELKEIVVEDIKKEIIAFANSAGGTLYVGVADDGSIVGVDVYKRQVQDKVIAINHLDCPWRPSDITQRDGRGVRQGNENPEVMIKQFVTTGPFDAYLWQIPEQQLRYNKPVSYTHLAVSKRQDQNRPLSP